MTLHVRIGEITSSKQPTIWLHIRPTLRAPFDYNILLHVSDRSVHQHLSSCNDLCCNIFPTYSPHRIRNLTPITQKEQLIIAHILGPFLFAFFPQTPFWALGAKSPRAIPFPMAIPLCTKFSTFLGCGGDDGTLTKYPR